MCWAGIVFRKPVTACPAHATVCGNRRACQCKLNHDRNSDGNFGIRISRFEVRSLLTRDFFDIFNGWYIYFNINGQWRSRRNACSWTSPPSPIRGWSASSRFRHRAARCGHQQHAERSARKAAHQRTLICMFVTVSGCVWVSVCVHARTNTHTHTHRLKPLWGHLTSMYY